MMNMKMKLYNEKENYEHENDNDDDFEVRSSSKIPRERASAARMSPICNGSWKFPNHPIIFVSSKRSV